MSNYKHNASYLKCYNRGNPYWYDEGVDYMFAKIDGRTSNEGYFTRKN